MITISFTRHGLASILTALALLSGCSATVQLRPDPIPVLSRLPDKKIAIEQFSDVVPEDRRIGHAKNLYGMTVRWVTLKPSVSTALSESITDVLNRSGMEADLLRTGQAPAGQFVLTGQLKDMTLESRPGWSEIGIESMVQFDAQLKQPDGRLVPLGTIEGRVDPTSLGGVAFNLDQSFEEAMSGAIQDGVRKLVEKIKRDDLLIE